MPSRIRTIAVGAIGNVVNPIAGWQYEVTRNFRARLDVACLVDAATSAGVLSLFSGSDLLANEDQIQVGAAITWPDNFQYSDVLGSTEPIGISLRTTLAGGDNYLVAVRLTPVGR